MFGWPSNLHQSLQNVFFYQKKYMAVNQKLFEILLFFSLATQVWVDWFCQRITLKYKYKPCKYQEQFIIRVCVQLIRANIIFVESNSWLHDCLFFIKLCKMYSSIRKTIWQFIKNCFKFYFFSYGELSMSITKCSNNLLIFIKLCKMYPSIRKTIWQCTKNCLKFHLFFLCEANFEYYEMFGWPSNLHQSLQNVFFYQKKYMAVY